MLSRVGLLVNSRGGAFVHNLIAGSVPVIHGEGRHTPYHKPHSTEVVGLAPNPSGDDRYYNNIFVNVGLTTYDTAKLPVFMANNIFLNGAKPSKHESDPLVQSDFDPDIQLIQDGDAVHLSITLDKQWAQKQTRQLITTALLGKAKIPNLPYEQPDGSHYRLDTDYLGKKRNPANPFPGPFEFSGKNNQKLKVWPIEAQ